MFIWNALESYLFSIPENDMEVNSSDSESSEPLPMETNISIKPCLCNSTTSNALPSTDVLTLIFLEYLKQNKRNPRSFLLTCKKFYSVSLSHPFPRLMNLMTQLGKRMMNQKNNHQNCVFTFDFTGMINLPNHTLTPQELRYISTADPKHDGLNVLLQSIGFPLIPYYRPLLDHLDWKVFNLTPFHKQNLDPKFVAILTDIHAIYEEFVKTNEEISNQDYWITTVKKLKWASLCKGATIPEAGKLVTIVRNRVEELLFGNHKIADKEYASRLVSLNNLPFEDFSEALIGDEKFEQISSGSFRQEYLKQKNIEAIISLNDALEQRRIQNEEVLFRLRERIRLIK